MTREQDIEEMLDATLDRARAAHPGVEWTICVPEEQGARLPVHGSKLWRSVNGQAGYYTGHVYRDSLVDALPLKPWFFFVAPVDDATVATFYGDLRSGVVTTDPPGDAFFQGS